MKNINGLNGDYISRDEIIFGEYNKPKYSGGIRSFKCAKDVIEKLLYMNFISEDECQNFSPSVKDFMDYAENVDNVTFECYAVSPERNDYRVTIEGIDVVIPAYDIDTLCETVNLYHGADEFTVDNLNNKYYIHAWWD